MKKVLLISMIMVVSILSVAEKVTITYVNWNLGLDIEKAMVQEFMKLYPNIEVKIVTAEGNYEDWLIAQAAAGKLPDVIMIPNIPMALTNDWALDLTKMALADPEWKNIPAPIRNATVYNNRIYAVPAGFYFMGYFVNDDLFDKYNVKPLKFAPTWNEFLTAIKKLTIPKDGIIGLAEEVQIPEWYPAMKNFRLGWYTWDEKQYNLDDPSFIEAVNIAKQLWQGKYVYDALPDEQKKQYNAGWYGDVWNQGKIAIRWSGTWDTPSFSTLPFKSRFIGVPGGRIPVVGDFFVISKTTKYPNEAFMFAKFVTYGKEGILKRLELDKKNEWSSMPLTTEKAVVEKYFSVKKLYPGLDEAYAKISSGIIEGVKIVPGYIQSRWTAPTGIKVGDNPNANIGDVIWNAMRGSVNIADYAKQLNKIANEQYQNAIKKISIMTK
ncbi:MAG: ABC transporter substrate-binding protein [Fervidobacterium sp.]|jgi:multiple sugar transport system substrate-binding protein